MAQAYDVLDGAHLVRFHDDGNVAAVWGGDHTVELYTEWDGDWSKNDSYTVEEATIDKVEQSITETFYPDE